jgi:hypothetical protein
VKKILAVMMMSMAALLSASGDAAAQAQRGNLEEAKQLVHKAREFIRKNGREKAFAEINKRDGQFVDRDMYIYVYDKNLKNLAHGGNSKLIGKDLADLRDPDGKYVNKGLLEAAQKGGGTYTFKFFNPASGKIEEKIGYAEMEGDVMVGSGVYTANYAPIQRRAGLPRGRSHHESARHFDRDASRDRVRPHPGPAGRRGRRRKCDERHRHARAHGGTGGAQRQGRARRAHAQLPVPDVDRHAQHRAAFRREGHGSRAGPRADASRGVRGSAGSARGIGSR